MSGVARCLGQRKKLEMAKNKAASDMSLGELEAALTGAKEKLRGMEQELAEYRKSVQSYVLEFGKRQRQFEREFGIAIAESAGNGRGSKSGGGRARRGTVAEGILSTLGKSSKPISVDEIVVATGATSKPSVAQTLMKLIQAGKVQRFNKDGKAISKNDDSQRAKSYSLA